MIGAGDLTHDQSRTPYSNYCKSCHVVRQATIRGLRYSVEWLLETLSSGMSNDEILADYEDLEQADIQAVLLYAARLSQVKRMSVALV